MGKGCTNKLPNIKIPITDRRCVTLACNPHTTRTGRHKMRISVVKLGTAFPMNEDLRLRQVPGMRVSQARAIGVHWKTLTRIMATHHEIDMPPRIMEAMRISLVGKMRQYMSKIETLVTATVVTYMHSNTTRSYEFEHGYQ